MGIPQQMIPLPPQPGTPKANFAKQLDSYKGIMASEGIRLMAQPGLRLTQQEIASAKDALATISKSTDQATFTNGVRRFQTITQQALADAQAIAANKYDPQAPPSVPAPPPGPTGTTQGGVSWQVLQ